MTNPPQAVPLRTGRLWLVPLDPERDAAELHPMYADPEVMRFWETPVHRNRAATARCLHDLVSESHAWAVLADADGPAVGVVAVLGRAAVPGLKWVMRRAVWGRGYAGEAATAVVEHALGELGMARVEAWVDVTNTRSLAVARRAGLTERGRLPQRYGHRDEPHCSLVLGRSARPEPTVVLNVWVELPVRDVAATSAALIDVLGMSVMYGDGDPPTFMLLGAGPWSGAQRVGLSTAASATIARVSVRLETATELDAIHARAVETEVELDGPPAVRPWGRREFVWTLADGHEVTVSGPS